jgi:hypothetical protein
MSKPYRVECPFPGGPPRTIKMQVWLAPRAQNAAAAKVFSPAGATCSFGGNYDNPQNSNDCGYDTRRRSFTGDGAKWAARTGRHPKRLGGAKPLRKP